MFKNPLKYQQGGQLNEQQQQMLAAFIDWLPKRVKEFQGMQPDAIVQALDGMSKTPEGQKQVQQLMEQFQQESQSVPSAKHGGKIQDFICKHGRGGVAGCGCEKPVLKGQEAIPGGMPRFQAPINYYNEKGWPISERDAIRRNNRTFYTEEPTTAGNLAWTNNQMSSQLMWPGVVQDIQYNLPVGHYIDEYGNMHNFAVQGEDLTRYNNRKAQWKGNGGKVEKADNGMKVNKKNKTVTNINSGLSTYDAEKLGIDPNTLVRTGSTITAFPNKKPYIVNGQVPFNKRNAIWFSLGGTESGAIEDGANIGGVPGRKYRVSQVGGQETNYGEYSNPEPYPYIIRYASPVDTMYNVGFTGYNNKSIAYPGIRALYNAAIDSGNIVAQDEASHKELQRQKSERKQNK